jgi:N-sulfoglucosamine sulfohydrolase
MQANQPNILYIHSHDTGRYVQPYGHAVDTPNIQDLAEDGVLFRQAFCTAPTCSPSRASLLTGQYAHSAGMLGLAHRGFALHDYRQHLLHTLRDAGYYAARIGEEHISSDSSLVGYDYVAPLKETHAAVVAPTAVSMLRDGLAQPFFLSVGFSETHRNYPPEDAHEVNYTLPPAPLPDTPEIRRDMAAFKASARELDGGIGAVLDALEQSGLAENTLVICTTDHGLAFPRMKGFLTDSGIGVMLIMRGPGGFRGGKVCDAQISQIDIFPTICDLLEIDYPSWLQGQSVLPLIREEAEQIHDAIFAEVNYHASYEPKRAVRTRRWKYIRRFDHHVGPILPNVDDSPSKDVLLAAGWQQQVRPMEALYDLIFDPIESCNLASDPSMAGVLEEMRIRLEEWMRETNDPLLQGSVPAPVGAELNDLDQISPGEITYRVV